MTSALYAGLACASFALALLPVALTLANLRLFRPPHGAAPPGTAVSVLIPARNEEAAIGAAVFAALANDDVELEVIVLDDGSSDRTADIVGKITARDRRVRLERAPSLPQGWVGKVHACQILAGLARHPVLLFQDADVRLGAGAIVRIAGFLLAGRAGLVSGFPEQRTETLGEALIVPLIHVVLLGYLPIGLMRRRRDPGLGAGCGQLIAVRADAYRAAGGHAAIRGSLHDGLTLPRAFRRAGFATDLFDATPLASCRMYGSWSEVWRGFSKNAHEGMATPGALPVWTVLLVGGHVLPWAMLAAAALYPAPRWAVAVAALAAAGTLASRAHLAVRFRQSWRGALLHPAAVLLLVALQWAALIRRRRGWPALWRGRAYAAD